MERLFRSVTRKRKTVVCAFSLMLLISLLMAGGVGVNYNMADYLPEEAPSTRALVAMGEAFTGGVPNLRLMAEDVTVPEALEIKAAVAGVDGVLSVVWLDDVASVYAPLETIDAKTREAYYKDGAALFTVTVDTDKQLAALDEIRIVAESFGKTVSLAGSSVNTVVATQTTGDEIARAFLFVIPMVAAVLLLTTSSYWEPILFLTTILAAILLNRGTNLIFGEISFVTNAAASILQLAVSMDYCIFLLHRFNDARETGLDTPEAMISALKQAMPTVLASGVTTVVGFLALCFMRFRLGSDMGFVMAKAIAISMICSLFLLPVLTLLTCKLVDKTRHKPFLPAFGKFAKGVLGARVPAACVFLIALVPSLLASGQSNFYYGAANIFPSSTRVYREREAIEGVFGKNVQAALLVPEGDLARETRLSNALRQIDGVTDVISYVDKAGAEVPTEYLDEETLSLLMSGGYSRMAITIATDTEGDAAFAAVEAIRAACEVEYPGTYLLAGDSVNTYDMRDTVVSDMARVNALAILAVLAILFLTTRSLTLPFVLVVVIESSIWINLAFPYFQGEPIFYFAYLIISSIQLGATVDYAILISMRYLEARKTKPRRAAVLDAVGGSALSVLTSAAILTIGGYMIYFNTTNSVISQLGRLVGRGAILSTLLVLTLLPALLYWFDKGILKTTKGMKGAAL